MPSKEQLLDTLEQTIDTLEQTINNALDKQAKKKNAVEFQDVKVVRKGTQIILPDDMSNLDAVAWLKKREEEDQRVVAVNERMSGFPLDCANAVALAIQERYGFKELRNSGFFGQNPPAFLSIPVDYTGKTTEIFLGRCGIPKLDSRSYIELHPDGFDGMWVTGNVKTKELPEVQAMVELARQKLKTDSLYKGKAFRLSWKKEVGFMESEEGFDQPEFMAPQPKTVKLLVNDDTQFLIEASIWAMIRNTERCRELGIPLKRSALAEGPFGVGKTLLAGATGDLAVENGWTFIYLRDVNKLKEAYQLAVRYQPAVLFAEDLDIVFSGSHEANHSLLNVLDGVDSKDAEVMLVLTTNYPEKLDQSILRPGRLDAVIPFRAPDAKTVQELVRHYAGDLLSADADLTTVGEILSGAIPAVIREVVERAKLYSLATAKPGDPIVLDSVSLVHSASGMRHHLEMLERQKAKPKGNALEQIAEVAGKYMAYGMAQAIKNPADTAKNVEMAPLLRNASENLLKQLR